MKIIIIGGLASSLINFRGELIKLIVRSGHEVIAMADFTSPDEVCEIEKLGCSFKPYPISRNGLNPISDARTLLHLYQAFQFEKPDIVLSYTIKPVVWGGISARLAGVSRFFGLITGLGFAFQSGNLKRNALSSIVKRLYKFSLKNSSGIIFQNPDNLRVFLTNNIVNYNRCYQVNGSGVKLSYYKYKELPLGSVKFLAIGRLLGEKGFREYYEAASIVKQEYPGVEIQLLGPEDPSPDGISSDEIKEWQKEGCINYLGSSSDVREFINQSHICVLPSYHEGMPRTVLESMSMGRPILTTDVEGCRETVIEGVNGFLVPKQDSKALAERMIWFIENRDKWQEMGVASRKIAEDKFDVHKVNNELMKIIGLKE